MQQVAEFKFPRSLSQKLLKNIRRVTVWLEKIVRSRWKQVAKSFFRKYSLNVTLSR